MARKTNLKLHKDHLDTYGFEHKLVCMLINVFMKEGKKAKSETIVLGAIKKATAIVELSTHDLMEMMFSKLQIMQQIRRVKIGGNSIIVADHITEVSARKKVAHLIRDCVRQNRKNNSTLDELANLLVDTHENKGIAIKHKEEKLTIINNNRGYSNFARRSKSKSFNSAATVSEVKTPAAVPAAVPVVEKVAEMVNPQDEPARTIINPQDEPARTIINPQDEPSNASAHSKKLSLKKEGEDTNNTSNKN